MAGRERREEGGDTCAGDVVEAGVEVVASVPASRWWRRGGGVGLPVSRWWRRGRRRGGGVGLPAARGVSSGGGGGVGLPAARGASSRPGCVDVVEAGVRAGVSKKERGVRWGK